MTSLLTKALYLGALLIIGGCVSPFAALQRFKDNGALLEEIRTEIADLKHSIHATEIELHLLEEKIDNQTSSKTGYLEEEVATLEKKIHSLEKTQDRVGADLKSTSSYGHQIQALDHKVEELGQLKSALVSISKYIESKKPSLYQVKDGDSLTKIAKTYGTSVETLKVLNRLEGDKILIGQTLQLPESYASPR
jgi:peptidoglycan endopeptidase LytE